MLDWRETQHSYLEWRKKELIDVKAVSGILGETYGEFCSRVALLLAYAHWEGAFGDNTTLLCDYLRGSGKNISNINQGFLLGFLDKQLDRLRDRNHSPEARMDLIEFLGTVRNSNFSHFDDRVLRPRSNLNSDRLKLWCRVIGQSPIFVERRRIFLDYQLVRLRHEIAHGGAPTLRRGEIESLIDNTLSLIDDLSEFVIEYIEGSST